MKFILRIALSIWVAVICYFFLNIIFGPCGLVEYAKLEIIKNRLEQHVSHLEEINKSLDADLFSIKEDQSEIVLRARKLGYYRENEGVIVLEGSGESTDFTTPGFLINIEHEPINNSTLLALFSVIFGLIYFISIYIFRRPSYGFKKRKQRVVKNRYKYSPAQATRYSAV